MVQCNRGCGASNLRWKVVKGKYKLFNNNDLIHMCNDGVQAHKKAQEIATVAILSELGLKEAAQIPLAEEKQTEIDCKIKDPDSMFTITGTTSGIAITGDDKKNPIYVPKVAVKELTRALFDFF